jgi:membrane protein YdbS with pleckstrin-like domain
MPDTVTCPKCGNVTPSARFCKHCGEPLHGCLYCGAKISSDSRFCSQCGMEAPTLRTRSETEISQQAYARYGHSLIPKDILFSDEVPLFETRPVLWLALMPSVVFIVVGLGILLTTYLYVEYKEILYACGAVFFVGIAWLLTAWLRWKSTIYAATSRRVLRLSGMLAKKFIECPLRSVQNIVLDISVWGRMNGFGTVRITGGNVEIEWENVDDPRETHRILNEIVDRHGHLAR